MQMLKNASIKQFVIGCSILCCAIVLLPSCKHQANCGNEQHSVVVKKRTRGKSITSGNERHLAATRRVSRGKTSTCGNEKHMASRLRRKPKSKQMGLFGKREKHRNQWQ